MRERRDGRVGKRERGERVGGLEGEKIMWEKKLCGREGKRSVRVRVGFLKWKVRRLR